MASSILRRLFLHRGLGLLVLPLLALSSAGCGIFEPDELPETKEYLVLFIGNSYLGWHDTPLMFEKLARAGGKTINIQSHVLHGYSLQSLAQIFFKPPGKFGRLVGITQTNPTPT